MDKLTIPSLKAVLLSLGEVTSGGKSDLICRLQLALEQRDKSLDWALDNMNKMINGATDSVEQPGGSNEQSADVSRYESDAQVEAIGKNLANDFNDVITPDDSASQMGTGRIGLVGSNAYNIFNMNEANNLHTETVFKTRRSRSLVSGVSRASSLNSRASASERRRESVVERARISATRQIVEATEKLQRERDLGKITRALEIKKQEEQFIRQKEVEELKAKVYDIETQAKIAKLQRDAEDKALEAEAEMWSHFERIDLGVVQDLDSQIPKLSKSVEMGETLSNRRAENRLHLDRQTFELGKRKQLSTCRDAGNRFLRDSNIGHANAEAKIECAGGQPLENGVFQHLMASNLRMCLPKLEVEVFSGLPEQYITFKQTIHVIMQSNTLSVEEKLRYLYQYTTGEPREIVRTALYMDPNDGFQEVWKTFEEKYGAPELIAGEFMDKLFSREKIGRDDIEGLKSFSVSLRLTSNVVNKIPHARSELEHPKSIRALIAKLPFTMQEKWRVMVHDRRIKNGSCVSYQDLVSFVDREVRIASDPIYGRGAMERETNLKVGPQGTRSKARVTINAVSSEGDADDDTKGKINSCHFCLEGHEIDQCKRFVALRVGERLDWIKSRRACFICLGIGHMAGRCQQPKPCGECKRWHHSLLHTQGGWRTGNEQNSWTKEDFQQRKLVGGVSTRGGTDIGSVSVLPVRVRNQVGKATTVSAFLDGGSAVSFCTPRLLELMGIERAALPRVILNSETVHSSKTEQTCLVTGLMVKGVEEDTWVSLPPVYLMPRIPVDQKDVVCNRDIGKLGYLSDIAVGEVKEVDLMIGSNALAALEPIEIRPAPTPGDPYGVRTRLGWTIQGLVNCTADRNVLISRVKFISSDIRKLVEDAFEVGFEDCGSDDIGLSVEDQKWIRMVESGCKVVEGQYEIPLPIREDHVLLPDSREVALRRAVGLRRKLMGNHRDRKAYEDCINSMINKGYAEKVESDGSKGKWYIPHFGVTNPRKPAKLRVVFDCAGKVKGIALNDLLLQGPDLANQLIDVLLRFREGRFAFTADIEAMFHQIRVPPQQRDYLRFLWWEGGLESGTLCEYRMASHLFGATSSPSVANYALRRVASDCKVDELKSVGDIVRSNFYVDDVLRGASDKGLLCQEAKNLKVLCAMGGFNLNKFTSNVPEFGSSADCTAEISGTGKCLGINWNRDTDRLFVDVDIQKEPGTMRELLSVIASVYDPLGIVAPVVLEGRLIFQSVIRDGGVQSWDVVFDQKYANVISSWIIKLNTLEKFSIPRSVVGYEKEIIERQLHVFGDASESGHAVVAYARIQFNDNSIITSFVWGKAKVNPLKTVTIPRLELVAAKLAACVGQKLMSTLSFPFDSATFWTDSMTVLRYLRNENLRFKSFVANRVSDIRRRSEIDQWRYVPSESNPADEGSRGFINSGWLNGPSFLLDSENTWPTEEAEEDSGTLELEVRAKVLVTTTNTEEHVIARLICWYSDWRKLIRAVAWLTKFKNFISKKGCGELSYEDRRRAEIEILIAVQRDCYKDEYDALSNGKPVKKGSRLYGLAVFIDNGLVRVGGRLEYADIPYGAKHPIILPSSHTVTDLIIKECHRRVGHLGVPTVLGETRKDYWIVRGYSAIKRELAKCVTCRKVKGKVMVQQMASLPPERLAEEHTAFTFTGLDCFGPYYVTLGRGRSQVKRYGVLFTCMTVRAVHLEIAEDLSTDAILRAISRFMARRGRVQLFRSDNGTNFVGARRQLLTRLNDDALRNKVQNGGIRWEFNPPHSSHFGGIWERVIRTVRRVLETVMVRKTFSDDALYTIFCEAEAAVNSRPLTIVGDDPDSEPLTPQRLLNLGATCQMVDVGSDFSVDVVKRWQHIQSVSAQFWRRWCREYRSELQGRHKWVGIKDNIQLGDVVLVVDEMEARCHWPLGRVTDVKKSKDGKVRSVKLFSKGKYYERPIAKLVLLVNGQALP